MKDPANTRFDNNSTAHPLLQRNVIQRADTYYPDGNAEPHVHMHNGGDTFTAIGHGHKTLRDNSGVRRGAILEAYQTLQGYNTQRARNIITWMVARYGVPVPTDDSDDSDSGENLDKDWLDKEQDNTPSGSAPSGFSYGSNSVTPKHPVR